MGGNLASPEYINDQEGHQRYNGATHDRAIVPSVPDGVTGVWGSL